MQVWCSEWRIRSSCRSSLTIATTTCCIWRQRRRSGHRRRFILRCGGGHVLQGVIGDCYWSFDCVQLWPSFIISSATCFDATAGACVLLAVFGEPKFWGCGMVIASDDWQVVWLKGWTARQKISKLVFVDWEGGTGTGGVMPDNCGKVEFNGYIALVERMRFKIAAAAVNVVG